MPKLGRFKTGFGLLEPLSLFEKPLTGNWVVCGGPGFGDIPAYWGMDALEIIVNGAAFPN